MNELSIPPSNFFLPVRNFSEKDLARRIGKDKKKKGQKSKRMTQLL